MTIPSPRTLHSVADGDPSPTDLPDVEPVGELLRVDPATLVIGANVRREATLTKAFLRSVADRGVREPIVVRRRDDGGLVVRKGKRRTLAAVETGRPTVPVFVEPGPPDADDTERGELIERIVDQLEENLHRTGTSDADEVRAHQQLLDLGLTAGQIARRTHIPSTRVKLTTRVARSELAAAAMERYDLTLDQVATIAEFDSDDTVDVDAVKVLTVAAVKEPDQFEHVAQRLRDQRSDTRLVADTLAELTASGVRIVDPDNAAGAAQLTGLRGDAALASGTELTPQDHAACPGHGAHVEVARGWDRVPHVRTVYWCTGPDVHGHVARWNRAAPVAGRRAGESVDGASAETVAEAGERAKAERRRVIANNKAWDSATTVRRAWLRSFLARKTAPRDALTYLVTSLTGSGHSLLRATEAGHPTGCELLGLEAPGSIYSGRPSPIAAAAATATSVRATQLVLAVLLGAAEDATGRQTWRQPTAEHRRYFTALRDWGYPLSPVEQLVLHDSAIVIDDAGAPQALVPDMQPVAEADGPGMDGDDLDPDGSNGGVAQQAPAEPAPTG